MKLINYNAYFQHRLRILRDSYRTAAPPSPFIVHYNIVCPYCTSVHKHPSGCVPVTYSSWDHTIYLSKYHKKKYKTKYQIELTQLILLTIKYTRVYNAPSLLQEMRYHHAGREARGRRGDRPRHDTGTWCWYSCSCRSHRDVIFL